ncbi:MAG: hypothetical protein Q9195_008539 [Heterodermia aff. obscurata]
MASVLDKLAASDLEAAQRADLFAQMIQSGGPSVPAGGKSRPQAIEADGTSKVPAATLSALHGTSPDTLGDPLSSLAVTKRKQCPRWCSCTCHSRRTFRSPGLLADLLGELNIYYNGRNQHRCNCSTSSLFNVTYRFPQFFLRRYISFICQYSQATGPEFLLRLPVIRPWGHKLWHFLIDGDITAIQKMYDQGLASPLDVSPRGSNSLIYAADNGSAELIHFLIDQGVDWNFPTERGDTPCEMLWDRAYGGMFGEDGSAIVRKVARRNDDLDDMGFSTLHKIILGVVYKDLRMVLEATTDLVNTADSRGRTPLHWAVLCNDAVAVETLLEFEADPNITDSSGYAAIDFARSSLTCKLLLDAKAQVRPNPRKKNRCALHYAVIGGAAAEVIDLLIDAGVDVNVTDIDGETPLINAIFWGRIEMARRLIERGADVNAANISSHESPVHFVANFDRPDLLSLILDRGADYKSVNIEGRDLGHCAARRAGIELIHIMCRSHLPGLNLDEPDFEGKTAKDYMNERVALTDREIGIHAAFETLAAYLAPLSKVTADFSDQSAEIDVESQVPISFDPQVPGAFPVSE